MISQLWIFMRRLRKQISRSRLAARLLGQAVRAEDAGRPGLIMIQVDGLARAQFETALKMGRLPFLSKLIRDGHFSLEIFCGWDPTLPPMSFPLEQGAHGGPGSRETHGFLLLPDRIRHWPSVHVPDARTRVRGMNSGRPCFNIFTKPPSASNAPPGLFRALNPGGTGCGS